MYKLLAVCTSFLFAAAFDKLVKMTTRVNRRRNVITKYLHAAY